jgi:predicted RNA-binding protein YlqC (UPF0109 family)
MAESPSPDYIGLVRFLLQPLLDMPDSLRVDCESVNQGRCVWIRLAFEGEDKGRVLGRGGRNLQAIRQVLATAAAFAGKSLHLDLYDPSPSRSVSRESFGGDRRSSPPRRFNNNKTVPRRPPRFSSDAS